MATLISFWNMWGFISLLRNQIHHSRSHLQRHPLQRLLSHLSFISRILVSLQNAENNKILTVDRKNIYFYQDWVDWKYTMHNKNDSIFIILAHIYHFSTYFSKVIWKTYIKMQYFTNKIGQSARLQVIGKYI